jgi:hypothetical protein
MEIKNPPGQETKETEKTEENLSEEEQAEQDLAFIASWITSVIQSSGYPGEPPRFIRKQD